MLHVPADPFPGQPLSTRLPSEQNAALRRLRVITSGGIRAEYTPEGTRLWAEPLERAAHAAPVGAWSFKSWAWGGASGTLTLANCCYRRSTGFALLPELSVALAPGERVVRADVDLADGSCSLAASASLAGVADDFTSGTAHIPLYTVAVSSSGAIGFKADWRGAPELLQYV